MSYTGQTFTSRKKPKVSEPFEKKVDAVTWCSENYSYGDDVWVVLDEDGKVADRGFCDYIGERLREQYGVEF